MKLQFIFLLTIMLSLLLYDNLQAQINEGVINYQIVTVMEHGIDAKLAELVERDAALAQDISQQIDDFMEDKSTSSSDTIGNVNMIYYFEKPNLQDGSI